MPIKLYSLWLCSCLPCTTRQAASVGHTARGHFKWSKDCMMLTQCSAYPKKTCKPEGITALPHRIF